MATIRTVFTLTDNVTPALTRMYDAAGLFNNRLEGIKTTLSGSTAETDRAVTSTKNLTASMTRFARTVVSISSSMAIFSNFMYLIGVTVGRVNALVKEYEEAVQAETMLTTVMRQRMNATDAMVDSVLNLANAMEKVGVYDADMIISGAQELATYVTNKEALDMLIPAMTNLVAQRRGYVATSQDFISVSTMMGKVMQGMTGSLQRVGYVFSDAEAQILKTGTEMERAAMLAQIITQNVGNMNDALAATDIGSIVNAGNRINAVKESLGEAFAPLKRSIMELRATFYEYIRDPFVETIASIQENLAGLSKALLIVGGIGAIVGIGLSISWAAIHWPITLIVAGMYLLIKVFSQLGNTGNNILGVLGSLLSGFGTIFQGVFTVAYNAVASVLNIFGSFYEMVVNFITMLSHNPFKAFITGVLNMAQVVLDVVGTIGSVIDVILGTSISETMKDATAAIEKYKTDMWEKEGVTLKTAGRFELETPESKLPDSIQSGYETGVRVSEALDNAFSSDKIRNALPVDANGNIMTSDANTVQLVDEMKEILARRSLEQYIVRVNQVTPQLSIENVNVSETADVDAVIEEFANSIDNMTNSSLGVGTVGAVM